MLSIASRRYTGAKTKLLSHIESTLLKHLGAFSDTSNLSFFDVFAGTGVVSAHFLAHYTDSSKALNFTHFYINDFLYANFAIYQGFFSQEAFDIEALESLQNAYNSLDSSKLAQNYYSKNFGNCFFSDNDARLIGHIRADLDAHFKAQTITKKAFYILLSSLLYSADRVANTVGHYDAYRKNVNLSNRFKFELIKPLISSATIEIFRQDANMLVKNLAKTSSKCDIAFIDPPYNSRQYARFYHLLETLTLHKNPTLYGVAKKPKPNLISAYCKNEAKEAFSDLIKSLAKCARILMVTYNNTYQSKSSSSKNKITLDEITQILQNVGKVSTYQFDFKAFSSGKTDFNDHKEIIFVCEVR